MVVKARPGEGAQAVLPKMAKSSAASANIVRRTARFKYELTHACGIEMLDMQSLTGILTVLPKDSAGFDRGTWHAELLVPPTNGRPRRHLPNTPRSSQTNFGCECCIMPTGREGASLRDVSFLGGTAYVEVDFRGDVAR